MDFKTINRNMNIADTLAETSAQLLQALQVNEQLQKNVMEMADKLKKAEEKVTELVEKNAASAVEKPKDTQ